MYARVAAYIALGTILIMLGAVLSEEHNFILSILLALYAVAVYFYIVLKTTEHNWLDIRAVFSLIWLGTIALAVLRFAGYQEPWATKTWMLLAAAYLLFNLGATIGVLKSDKFFGRMSAWWSSKGKISRHFEMNEKRMFNVCVITSLIGLICFCISIKIKGFVPAFSTDVNAYVNFYTKFHIFTVAATTVSGLCYYCMKKFSLPFWKKAVLLLCIFYNVFFFPVLVVSRGVFMVAALSLAVSVFYVHDKKFLPLVICIAAIMLVYIGTSELRNYTGEQLSIMFEPTEVQLDSKDHKKGNKNKNKNNKDNVEIEDEEDEEGSENTIMLPPKLAFMYGYMTVSHDNFNEAVVNAKDYTYGARQLAPINVILRSEKLDEIVEDGEYYQVNPYLNTTNMLGSYYYDFHSWGVLLVLIWAIVFGIIQGYYESSKDPFSLLALGNVMCPVALGFFSTWTDMFNFWLMWGTVLLLTVACCLKKINKGEQI